MMLVDMIADKVLEIHMLQSYPNLPLIVQVVFLLMNGTEHAFFLGVSLNQLQLSNNFE